MVGARLRETGTDIVMVEVDRVVSRDQELGTLVVSLGTRLDDIAGCVTGFGTPDWARTHALVVGIVGVGKTVMDEMAYNINGWFARDLATLSRVTDVLLPPVPVDAFDAELRRPSCVIIPVDSFKILGSVEDRTYEILNALVAKVFENDAVVNNANIGDFISSNVPSIGNFMTDLFVVEASSSCVPFLSVISCAMRVLQREVHISTPNSWPNLIYNPKLQYRLNYNPNSQNRAKVDKKNMIQASRGHRLWQLLAKDGWRCSEWCRMVGVVQNGVAVGSELAHRKRHFLHHLREGELHAPLSLCSTVYASSTTCSDLVSGLVRVKAKVDCASLALQRNIGSLRGWLGEGQG
uniref:Uncharacterized protein n=1 Tax=Aegilops tauschii TaxID=37682 RepID=M8BL66_AEGTA